MFWDFLLSDAAFVNAFSLATTPSLARVSPIWAAPSSAWTVTITEPEPPPE